MGARAACELMANLPISDINWYEAFNAKAAIFKSAGLPLRQPPAGSCNDDASLQGPPSIVSPLRGVTHMRRLNKDEPVYLRAEAGSGSSSLLWFVDNAMVGRSKP